MQFTDTDKITVLIHLLDHQAREIQRREAREQQLFEWSVGLLLATFGAVVALSDRDQSLAHPHLVKLLASFLIGIPIAVFAKRILHYSKRTIENAEAIDLIEDALHLYEKSYNGKAVYPQEWAGKFSQHRKERDTQKYYSAIMLLMGGCVIATIWLIL